MIKLTNLIAAGILSRNLAIFLNVWVGNNEQFAGCLFHLSGTKLSLVQIYTFFIYTCFSKFIMVVYLHLVTKGISRRPVQIPWWVKGYRKVLGFCIKKLKLQFHNVLFLIKQEQHALVNRLNEEFGSNWILNKRSRSCL